MPGVQHRCRFSTFRLAHLHGYFQPWTIYVSSLCAERHYPRAGVEYRGPGSVLQDQWNHLVVVVSNGVTVTNVYGYLNGVLVAGPTALPAYVPNDGFSPATFTIGERSDDSYLFDGDVDEVAYYTNALDANAVLAHYQAGTNASPATPYSQLVLQQRPIIYYHLDEASAGSPYPAALPVASNLGSAGPAANGYYESGTVPGAPGPFGSNSLACMFVATNGGPAGTSGPGVLCDPYDLTVLNATNALTIAAWVQVPTTPNTDFETVLGRSDSSFRLSVDTSQLPHFAAAPNSDLTGTIAINDGNWHLWTGVYDPVSGKADLYIDGLVEASADWSALNSFEQVLLIGGAPDYNGTGTRAFAGSISDVAIFTNALTQAQIQAAYATIGVPPSPPIIVQQPVASEILFAGATLSADLTVTGPGPFTYQWYFNSSNQVAGATSAALSLANVQTTNAGSYDCVVSNHYGGTNSTSLILTVVSPLSDKYDAAILANKALCFYPLNETSGTTAYEYVQGNNGTYETNSLIGQPGVEDPPYLGFPATDFSVDIQGTESNSWVSAPFGALAGSNGMTIPNLTLTCWIYPVGVQNTSTGLIFDRGGATGGLGISPSGGATAGMLGYVWNNNNGDTYDFVSNLTPPDSQWSLVALSIAPTEAVLYLYSTSGRASATNAIPHSNGLLDGAWRLGNDADADPGRTFNGMMDAVAVFPSTLSPSQMNALFDTGAFGTTNVPPTVVVPSTPITVDQGGSGSIVSTVIDGPPPFTYQWYYLISGTTNTVAGATNGTLALTDIQAIQGSYQYYVVVANAYGAATSSFATLNILSGPPTLVADVSPLLTVVPAGTSVSLSMTVSGTEPFSYQWSNGGGLIGGATNSSYVFDALAGSNNYFVTVSNSFSAISSSTAAVVGVTNAPAVLGFNGTGSNWTLNQFPNVIFMPFITNNILELTDGNLSEASSAFYNTPQYIGGFVASYTYQVGAASSVADGVTFCIQDSTNTADEDPTNAIYGVGPSAVGNGGGDLGYNDITPSVAFQMNVYTGSSGGVGISFATNGLTVDSTPANPPYGGTAPVNISSFDPILVQLYYSQGDLTVLLTDGKLAYKTNYFCDIPGTLGSSSAFVGFTGASGGVGGLQTVSDFQFSYTTDPVLSVKPGVSGSVTISWPVSVTTLLELQESATLLGPWSNVGVSPIIVGSENQVTVTPGTSTAFFRLSLH